jgi:hypothetical protein
MGKIVGTIILVFALAIVGFWCAFGGLLTYLVGKL